MDPMLAGSLALLVLYAFVHATDIALLSLNDKRLEDMEAEGKKCVPTLKKLLDMSERYIAAVRELLILLAAVITVFAVFSGPSKKLTVFFESFPAFSYIIVIFVVSCVIVLIGELIPRKIAAAHYERYAAGAYNFMRLIYIVMLPLNIVLELITSFVVKLFGVDPKTSVGEVTEEGILSIVDEGEEIGVIDEDEGDMINNIIEFGDTTAQKIMTHRTDVVAMPITADFKEVIRYAEEEHFSRIPVYDGTLDNIVGVLHIKALIPYIDKGEPSDFKLKDIINEPYFVPQSKKANDLLKELQNEKTHMAIVIDEYGGTAGIVTMEDLIEFVFGSIQDEFDDEDEDTKRVDEKTFEVDGAADFEETFEEIGIKLTRDEREEMDYEKMAGFIMGELDRIPEKGDKISFKGYEFEVLNVDEKRIEKIKITVPEQEVTDGEDGE